MKKFLLKNKNIIILFFISAALSFYLMLPVIMYGTRGIFFTLDPDAHYIGNVISYIKSHRISYINHPATPTIMAYVYALTPVRFYTKFIAHTSFVDWYILHSEIVYLYLRIFQNILFGIGLFIFSLSVYRITRSLFLSLFSVLSLFTFGFFTDIALHIRSETTSFLIISIWIFTFVSFILSKRKLPNFLLIIISGLAIANKFTNIFYFLATLSLIPTIKGISLVKKIIIFFVDIFIGFISFIFFTWPIRQKYPQIIRYIFDFFPQTGVSVANKNSLFDLKIYSQNLFSLFRGESWLAVSVILTFSLMAYLFFKTRRKILTPVFIFACIMFLGILVFARYPLNYYQLTHFAGMVFILYFLLSNLNRKISVIIFLIFLSVAVKNLSDYYPQVANAINRSKNLDDFVASHPSKVGIIWERGDAKDFALLWGNSWSGAGYSEVLTKLRPDLLFEIYFHENYEGNKSDIFTICWDKFYMQKNYLDSFVIKYKNNHFTQSIIPGTNNMYVVERNNCEP